MSAILEVPQVEPERRDKRRPQSQAQGHSDDMQTPPAALDPLVPYLRPEWVIWEPACGKGNLVRGFEDRGFRTIGSDIRGGRDFLKWQPEERWDVIATNPPYSCKDAFLARAYALGRPFAFLVPLTTLEGKKRQAMFRKRAPELILFPWRVNFETPSGRGTGAWFMTCWVCWGLGIGRQLTFWEPTALGQGQLFGEQEP